MNPGEFHNMYLELIDENPLAIRAVLKVLRIEFTDTVPTLAVTCEAQPRLLVNLAFVREHCRTEAQSRRSSATSSCTCCCGTPSASPRSRRPSISRWTR